MENRNDEEATQAARDITMRDALSDLAHVYMRAPGVACILCYAPDSSEYADGTDPGGDWDEECDRLIAEVRAALPAGWSAEWSDDDLILSDGALTTGELT